MGLQSALSTALTGLSAAEASIDVVGNNVANSQTVGFKESSVSFATQFLQTQSIGAAPSTTSGGTNPRQIGLGTKVAEITPSFTQGTIEISSNPLDVAIQGEGFLIVQGSQGGQFYTRNGQLKTNENNEVVTTTGQRVMGYNAVDGNLIESLTPVVIPIGEAAVASSTENVFIAGTLTPTAEVGDTPSVIESSVLATKEFEIPDSAGFTISDVTEALAPSVGGIVTGFTGGAGPAAGDYNYRFVFTDPQGNEGAISLDHFVTATGTDTVNLSGLQPASGDYSGVNVYRTTVGGTGDYFLVGSATDPTGTPTFNDTVLDGALGTIINTDSLDQTAYSYYVTFASSSGQPPESRPTLQVGSVPINQPGGRIRLKDIPLPATGDYDRIRIYRNTSADSSTFYRVADIPGTQDVYMDTSSDNDISTGPSVNTLDLDGTKIKSDTLLTNVQLRNGQDFTDLFEEGTLSFTSQKGDRQLEAKELTITATTTVQELVDFVTQASGIDSSVPSSSASSVVDGKLQFISNIGIENAVSIGLSAFQLTPSAASSTTVPVTIPFSETQAANGSGSTTDFIVYDSLGIPLTVRLTTVLESKSGTNTVYRWFASSPDNEPLPSEGVNTVVGTGTLTFDGNGDLASGQGSTSVAINRLETASQSPLAFDLDFSSVTGLANTDNLGQSNSTLNVVSQDGFAPGVLTSFAITESGEIRGVFSNGVESALAQVRMARFTNSAGLQQSGDNLFAEGVNSGAAQEGNPGANGLGTLTAGAVELSNSDIGQNLIELILASTQYRGGARVITAVQQLLDELLALRR